jgi:endonuclease/exonuclease/phosphatase family metal-dependent hydrolase
LHFQQKRGTLRLCGDLRMEVSVNEQSTTENDTPASIAPPRRRWALRAVKLVLLLLAGVIGWYIVGRATASSRAVHFEGSGTGRPLANGRPLKILAYNIAHGRGLADTNWAGDRKDRLTQIGELLEKQDADVVVLNEVDLDSNWSGRVNQGELIANVAGYPWRAEQTNYDLYLPAFRIRFGNVILSRLPIVNAKRVRYASPSKLETAVYGQKDGLLCMLDLGGGRRVRVLGVHLESRFEPTRVATLPAIEALLEDPAAPLILAGDFNAELKNVDQPQTALDTLMQSTKLIRAEGIGASFPADAPTILIDHILVQPPLKVGRFQIVDTQLSDHRPVMADVELRL